MDHHESSWIIMDHHGSSVVYVYVCEFVHLLLECVCGGCESPADKQFAHIPVISK